MAPVVGDTAAAPSMVEGAVLPDAAAGTGEVTSATASEMSSEAPAKEIVATADAAWEGPCATPGLKWSQLKTQKKNGRSLVYIDKVFLLLLLKQHTSSLRRMRGVILQGFYSRCTFPVSYSRFSIPSFIF